MNYQLIIRKKAENQITEAFNWYESKRVGLGDDFLLCIEASLTILNRNPYIFQVRYKNIRTAITPRFPYGVCYFVDAEKIIVIAVLHLSRDPKLWNS